MDTKADIWEILESLRIVESVLEAEGLRNGLLDRMEAHSLGLEFLQECVDYLFDSIVFQIRPEIRGYLFDAVEGIYRKCPAVRIDVGGLVAMFDESDPSLIANTLLLLPIASRREEGIAIAGRYVEDQDSFIRRNALYALEHLERE